MNAAIKKINDQIEDYKKETGNSADDISDGYHSFGIIRKPHNIRCLFDDLSIVCHNKIPII